MSWPRPPRWRSVAKARSRSQLTILFPHSHSQSLSNNHQKWTNPTNTDRPGPIELERGTALKAYMNCCLTRHAFLQSAARVHRCATYGTVMRMLFAPSCSLRITPCTSLAWKWTSTIHLPAQAALIVHATLQTRTTEEHSERAQKGNGNKLAIIEDFNCQLTDYISMWTWVELRLTSPQISSLTEDSPRVHGVILVRLLRVYCCIFFVSDPSSPQLPGPNRLPVYRSRACRGCLLVWRDWERD